MRFDRTVRKTAWFAVRNRQSKLILAGFLLILVAASIVTFGQLQKETLIELQATVHTDKEIYHSGETMSFFLNLSESVGNATISIRGIKDSMGRYRVQQDYFIASPQRSLNFTFAMPSCYGCAGISPGYYEIIAEIFSNGLYIANATKTVRLEK